MMDRSEAPAIAAAVACPARSECPAYLAASRPARSASFFTMRATSTGDNRFGRSCLVARRLVEAGVGCITVPWTFKQSEQNFDTHSKHFPKMKDKLLPVF